MSAAELRALVERLNSHATVYGENANAWANEIRQAAELIDLLAWAEERGIAVERCFGHLCVWVDGKGFHGDTLLDTLRRAREAAR